MLNNVAKNAQSRTVHSMFVIYLMPLLLVLVEDLPNDQSDWLTSRFKDSRVQ